MKNRAHFTLLPLMHWVAVVMLAGSAIVALSGFLSLPAAVAAGTVLTFLLKTLLEQAIEAFYGRRWVFGTVYAVGGFAIVCVTTALTAATLTSRSAALLFCPTAPARLSASAPLLRALLPLLLRQPALTSWVMTS